MSSTLFGIVDHLDDEHRYDGSGIVDSLTEIAGDIFDIYKGNEVDAFGVGVDAVAVSLDTLSIVLNPLGELVKCGVGWLMEHLVFLREPLEVVTGDPDQIEALADTWLNVSEELRAAAQDYAASLGGITWSGEAAQRYQDTAKGYIAALEGGAVQAQHAAKAIAVAGLIVATERAIIFDIIATFISRVITQAIIAAAASVATLGGSLAAFAASVTADACLLMGRISIRLAKLLRLVNTFLRRFGAAGAPVTKMTTTLRAASVRRAAAMRRQAMAARGTLAKPTGKLGEYVQYTVDASGSVAGRVDGYLGTGAGRVAKETLNESKERIESIFGDPGKE